MEEGRTLRAGPLQVEKVIEDSELKQTQSFLGRNFVPKPIKTHRVVSLSTGAAHPLQSLNRLEIGYLQGTLTLLTQFFTIQVV